MSAYAVFNYKNNEIAMNKSTYMEEDDTEDNKYSFAILRLPKYLCQTLSAEQKYWL